MKDKKTVLKLFVNREKEESYLNRMNRKGWKLVSVRFALYTFERTELDQYKTVLYLEERLRRSDFIRTATECGLEIAHQSVEGKYILFYVNVPTEFENIEFLTDNQGKIDFKKRLCVTLKRKAIILLIPFVFFGALLLYPLPAVIKIINYSPTLFFHLLFYHAIGENLFPFIMFAILVLLALISGIVSAHIFSLYFRAKREISEISSKMEIYE